MRRDKGERVKRVRAWELDALRGLAILLVVWDHVMFTMGFMFYDGGWEYSSSHGLIALGQFALDYWNSTLRLYGWPVFVFIFFFVSGICTAFSRNNLFRGLKLAAVALAVSGITYILEEFAGFGTVFIQFGVLHCLSLSILLFSLVEFIVKLAAGKSSHYRWIKAGVYGVVAIVMLVLHLTLNVSLIEVNAHGVTVPDATPVTGMFLFTNNWWTADYFPLFPFFVFFMFGAAISPVLYDSKQSLLPKLDGKWHCFLSYPGRYSLWIYLAIQVVAVSVLWLVTLAVTGEMYFIG